MGLSSTLFWSKSEYLHYRTKMLYYFVKYVKADIYNFLTNFRIFFLVVDIFAIEVRIFALVVYRCCNLSPCAISQKRIRQNNLFLFWGSACLLPFLSSELPGYFNGQFDAV